jgi:hypothetical protein
MPEVTIEYCIPCGVNGLISGSPKVEIPSPPNLVPNIENKATFWLIDNNLPSAGRAPVP